MPARNTSVVLGEHFEMYISNKVRTGRYNNSSEVIREGLRRMEEEDMKLEALRTLLTNREKQVNEGKIVKGFSYKSLMEKINRGVVDNK